ncbi:hypothetical protein IscW_ISCW014073, partial [Ixodes scapularis]
RNMSMKGKGQSSYFQQRHRKDYLKFSSRENKKRYQHTEDNPSPLRRVRLRGHVRARPPNTTQCTQKFRRTTRTTAEIRDSSRRRRSTAPCTTTPASQTQESFEAPRVHLTLGTEVTETRHLERRRPVSS